MSNRAATSKGNPTGVMRIRWESEELNETSMTITNLQHV